MSDKKVKKLYILDFDSCRVINIPDTGKPLDEAFKEWVDEESFYNGVPSGTYSIVSEKDLPLFSVSKANTAVIRKRPAPTSSEKES